MTVPRALVAGVLIVALGGVGSRIVHVGIAHRRAARVAVEDKGCAAWDVKARLAAYAEAQKWGRLPNGAPDVRAIADGWLFLYKSQRWYPGDGAAEVARPSYC